MSVRLANTRCTLGVMVSCLLISACSHMPWSEQIKDVRKNYGLLQCDGQDFCPSARIVQADSNLSQVVLEVRMSSAHHHYDIHRVTFDNHVQLLNYMPTRPTWRSVNQGLYQSYVRITVPTQLLQQLQGEQIAMEIHTDRGTVRRYLYDRGQASVLYMELKRYQQ